MQSAVSSFECDAAAMEAILGLTTIGDKHIRLDASQPSAAPKTALFATAREHRHPLAQPPIVLPSSESQAEIQRERLMRLLEQQQSWYDAHQQAASAAEQLLSLCEHHQQQWLHPNQQTL